MFSQNKSRGGSFSKKGKQMLYDIDRSSNSNCVKHATHKHKLLPNKKKKHIKNVDMVIQTTFKFNHNDIPIIKQVYLQYLIDIEYYTYRKYFDFQHSFVMIILFFLYDPCFLAKMKQKLANKKSLTRIPLISLAA